MSYPGGNWMPELSDGTHFFQDLVETEIFYLALFTEKTGSLLNYKMLEGFPDALSRLAPEGVKYSSVVRVLDTHASGLEFVADLVSQKVVCFI